MQRKKNSVNKFPNPKVLSLECLEPLLLMPSIELSTKSLTHGE
jgi:hypothetical protein